MLWPAAAFAQRLGGAESPDFSIWRILLALLVCLLLALFAIWFLYNRNIGGGQGRRFTIPKSLSILAGPAQERHIEIVEIRKLSAQQDICLLRNAGREYLILLSGEQNRVLRESPVSRDPGEADDGAV